jgi:hypothetical protein
VTKQEGDSRLRRSLLAIEKVDAAEKRCNCSMLSSGADSSSAMWRSRLSAPSLDVAWDPAKALSNLARHGVSFDQAATVLLDPLALTVFDAEHSQAERESP